MKQFLAFLVLCALPLAAQTTPIKVKIEASQWDTPKLLAKLNENGQSKHLQFAQADKDFDYRIVFGISQSTPNSMVYGSSTNHNAGEATVFTPTGETVFVVRRANRITENGVLNSVSKEVVKRLAEWRAKGSK